MAQRRSATEKAKATRQRSWNKNQEAKQKRIADQTTREEHNRKVGTTGKQRANQAAKEAKRIDSALKGEAAKPVTVIEQEDLLEQ